MKAHRTKIGKISIADYIKASRKGRMQAEQEILGPGFHSSDRIHSSKKLYTRKKKHKDEDI